MAPPSLSSPALKAAFPSRTSSQDDGIRKRVGKACDRCRLKKSKCDGTLPCTRCKADNAICVFGERKRSQDKVYPRGYVEMLEQQQSQLVSGLQELYRRLRNGQSWDGAALTEIGGHPLTHDILAALNLLEGKQEGDYVEFEEDFQKMQARLLAEGAGFATMRRRGSMSSESDHSLHDPIAPSASRGTPIPNHATNLFRQSFQFSAPTSPFLGSPVTKHASVPSLPKQTSNMSQFSQLSSDSGLSHDPQFYQAGWALPDMTTRSNTTNDMGNELTAEKLLQAQLALQAAQLEHQMSLAGGMAALEQPQESLTWDDSTTFPYDVSGMVSMGTWPAQQLMTAFATSLPNIPDVTAAVAAELDSTDIDLNQYLQAAS